MPPSKKFSTFWLSVVSSSPSYASLIEINLSSFRVFSSFFIRGLCQTAADCLGRLAKILMDVASEFGVNRFVSHRRHKRGSKALRALVRFWTLQQFSVIVLTELKTVLQQIVVSNSWCFGRSGSCIVKCAYFLACLPLIAWMRALSFTQWHMHWEGCCEPILIRNCFRIATARCSCCPDGYGRAVSGRNETRMPFALSLSYSLAWFWVIDPKLSSHSGRRGHKR